PSHRRWFVGARGGGRRRVRAGAGDRRGGNGALRPRGGGGGGGRGGRGAGPRTRRRRRRAGAAGGRRRGRAGGGGRQFSGRGVRLPTIPWCSMRHSRPSANSQISSPRPSSRTATCRSSGPIRIKPANAVSRGLPRTGSQTRTVPSQELEISRPPACVNWRTNTLL